MSWTLWLIIFLITIGSNEYASLASKCVFKSLTSRYYRWGHLKICVKIFWWECKLYKIKKKISFIKYKEKCIHKDPNYDHDKI